MKREDSKRPSESYIMGVVALIFLIIGYQTAMFVHRAAVMKIEAGRDHPDTVYIYNHNETKVVQNTESGARKEVVVRSATHSPRVKQVRENLPRRKVESFRFNPNTVTEDELCRLGFSIKQAKSIINYRQKGGRFRRKEDFSRSFVVSDSIYRRLESYIDIPLVDLNLADSAAFDALPGIGGWFASKIIAHRNALKGFSYKEQLMDVWKFDSLKYEALKDLVIVSPEHRTPYPLWSSPADSLRRHPYIRNYETARAIVLYRENTPREQWTIEGLYAAGIISAEIAEKMSACIFDSP